MSSRAELRVIVERTLRGIVIAALAVLLQSLRESGNSGGQSARARGVGDLVDWSSSPNPPGGIHVQLDSVPRPGARAWIGALAGAGSRVTWSGDVPPVMIDAQPVASPAGGTKVMAAAPPGSSVVVSDDVGAIDTVRTQYGGATLELGSAAGQLTASVDGSVVSTIQRDSVVLNKVLVIGSTGWESKFVTAALEEEDWKVDSFIRVAPAVDLTQGSAAVIDTSRYSAVVALDGAASPYANRIVEFARTGGGVVLTSQSASIDALSRLRAGSVGRANAAARPIQGIGSATLATLPFTPILSLRSGAVPLERRAGAVTTAASRIGAGRVVQIGYGDTWRWRMGGGDDAVRDHRVWWTELVSSVASSAPVSRNVPAATTDEAPMIDLAANVGRVTPAADISSMSGTPSNWMMWLFLQLALALIGEITSRRLRGAA